MGELRGASVTLAEIIAYLKDTRQTGRLTVHIPSAAATPADSAVLIFADGHLLDARAAREAGDDLVYRLLGRREAAYAFDRLALADLPAARSISRGQELLLLAAIGALSEEEAGVPAAPIPREDPPPVPPSVAAAPAPTPRPFKRRNRLPLPQAQMTYAQITPPQAFFELLETLERAHHSGYVTWVSDSGEGLLLLYEGQVINAFWTETRLPAAPAGRRGPRSFVAAVSAGGDCHLQVYRLEPDFVWSYASLAYGVQRGDEQALEHVQWAALLARLEAAGHTGCVKAVAGDQAAYLFLCRGRLLGEFAAPPDTLRLAPGQGSALAGQPGSLVDIFTSPTQVELLALSVTAWPVERVAAELRRTAQEVLGPKAGQVAQLIAAAGADPRALQAACLRAKQLTRVFVGPDEHAELSRRLDRLLAHLT